jgi:hypothetical protein
VADIDAAAQNAYQTVAETEHYPLDKVHVCGVCEHVSPLMRRVLEHAGYSVTVENAIICSVSPDGKPTAPIDSSFARQHRYVAIDYGDIERL